MTMNATERARRSDSLYYDTQVTNRRALCDMIANRESDLTESKAENAKLRELVRDMWHEGMCECGSRGKCASCEYDYPTRMRELGLEEEE